MRVTFLKSDACAERHIGEPDDLEMESPANMQLTYSELRTTRDWSDRRLREGDVLAYLDEIEGDWIVYDGGRALHFSDVVIGDE